MDEKKIFGFPVDGQYVHYFKKDRLLFVQNWKKSRKIEIPMFYTKKGSVYSLYDPRTSKSNYANT